MFVSSNLTAQLGVNQMRIITQRMNSNLERISNGKQMNHGADDPSGIAISSNMNAQLTGTGVAISNVQDVMNLLETTDAMIGTAGSILTRMRDLALRLANRATVSGNPAANIFLPAKPSESRVIRSELSSLFDELQRITASAAYNGKANTLNGGFVIGLEFAQVGPNNDVNEQINIVLPDLTGMLNALSASFNPLAPPSNADDQTWLDYAGVILDAIDEKNPALPAAAQFGLPKLLDARGDIGSQINSLKYTLDGLHIQYINLAGAKSRFTDTDIASEAADLTKNQILMNSTMAIYAQANANPRAALDFLTRSVPRGGIMR